MIEQGTQEWFDARLGHVTASKLSDVMMKATTAGYQNYLAQIVCERLTGKVSETFTSAAMQHGTDTEGQARSFYELEAGLDVQQVGFVVHPDISFTGASPDGLIGDDGGIEIKCPQPAKHIKNLMGGKIDKNYMLQMQWGMECTDRQWWDYVSFSPEFPDDLKIHIQRIPRDEILISEMKKAVAVFLTDAENAIEKLKGAA